MDPNVQKMFDLAVSTLSKYPGQKWRNLMLQQAYIFRSFMQDGGQRDMTGLSFKFNAIIKGGTVTDDDATSSGTGRYDGAYDKIPIGQEEFMAQGDIDWAHFITSWTISELEIILNAGEEGYIDIGKTKVEGVSTKFANMMEAQFWRRDGYSFIGTKAPAILGPEYFVTDDGYAINDGTGANFATARGSLGLTVAGIDPTDAAYNDVNGVNRWRNQFKSISTPNALLDGMDDLWLDVGFKAPEGVSVNTSPESARRRIVFNKNGFRVWKKMMRRLGEPLSPDKPTYDNVTVEWADSMVARPDGKNQGFFLDKNTWKTWVAKGKNFAKSAVRTPDGQPNVRSQYIELWPAVGCIDRRMNGKIFGFGNELVES